MSTAIEFNHVSKQYRLGLVSTKTLSHDIRRFWITNVLHKEDPYLKIGETNDRASKGNSDYVWALRDITFNVEQGDVVGIIGKNGAGKSTLLKLLSRVTGPTTGTIRAHGRIGSLLEVGTGFHPEMTGRENIFMNGAILGMTKREIQAKLDEIIDFSGCERYIDTPVKRYSSGMMVRLGFAVAAHLDPEILVVDEVLAVGDAEFQKKAIGKMQDVSQGEGRTVLFVSHNMASVRQLCNTGVVLKNGMVDYTGTASDCIDYYLHSGISECSELPISEIPREKGCSNKVRFVGIEYLDEDDNIVSPHCGKYLKIRLKIQVNEDVRNCEIGLGVRDRYENPMLSMSTEMSYGLLSLNKGNHILDLIINKLPLTEGSYKISLSAGINNEFADFILNAIKFDVSDDDFYGLGRSMSEHLKGKVVLCDHKWTID